MAATQTRPPDVNRPDGAASGGHPLAPRKGLPGGRAVVGGLLVAVAAVGIFAVVSGAGQGPSTRFVVAARELKPGTKITARDLETTAVELPDSLARSAFRDESSLIGALVLSPLAEGELLQAGGLGDGSTSATPVFSISLPRAAAVSATLQPGDRVQVYVNYGSDTATDTRLVVSEAEVIDSVSPEDAVGATGEVEVTLAIESDAERIALINATSAGEIVLQKITGVAEPGEQKTFKPDVDSDTASSGEDDDSGSTTTTGPDDGG